MDRPRRWPVIRFSLIVAAAAVMAVILKLVPVQGMIAYPLFMCFLALLAWIDVWHSQRGRGSSEWHSALWHSGGALVTLVITIVVFYLRIFW